MLLGGKAKGSRRKGKSKHQRNRPVNPVRPDIQAPTPERVAKADAPERRASGGYRVIDQLEWLYRRGRLDTSPGLAEAMFVAGRKLQEAHRAAGLDVSCGSSNLDRVIGGPIDPAHMLPADHALAARQEFRRACRQMGWYLDSQTRGCGRITVAIVCYGLSLEDAAGTCLGAMRRDRALAIVMDRLQIGLQTLVSLWRLTRRSHMSAVTLDDGGAIDTCPDLPHQVMTKNGTSV